MKKILFSLLLFGTFAVEAAFFQGTSSGNFSNPTGPSGMTTTGAGTNLFTWGTPTGVSGHDKPSSFEYEGNNFDAFENSPFIIGSLTYYNGTIFFGTGAKAVILDITLDFIKPLSTTEDFSFNLKLINTNNSKNSVSSADFVNIRNSYSYSFFTSDDTDYTLEFLGFGSLTGDGFTVDNSFRVIEDSSATVDLLGRITSNPSTVPIPPAIWLFGSGIIAIVAIRKKRGPQSSHMRK